MPRRPYSVPGSLLFALVFAFTGLLPHGARAFPPAQTLALVVIPLSAIFGVPFAYWLPIARTRFVGRMWRLPSQTLLLPRFLVCLIATMMIGAVFGSGLLGIWVDHRYLILGLGHLLFAVAFTASAARRFRHHPLAEFVMPSTFPFPLRGRM